jgi:hypothetical protein
MSNQKEENKKSFLKDVLFGVFILILPLIILYFLFA